MDNSWYPRLLEAIERDPRSRTAISIAAGLGPNYLQQMIKDGKEPGANKLERLLAALGTASTFYIMTGIEAGPEDEEFLRVVLSAPPAMRKHLQALIEAAVPQPE